MTECWAILELMGHRRLAGIVSEEQVAGTAFVRIDVPGEGEKPGASQFYSPAAVYCITPTSEETARAFARGNQPAPVQRWELAALPEVARDEAEDHALFGDSFDRDDEGDPL